MLCGEEVFGKPRIHYWSVGPGVIRGSPITENPDFEEGAEEA
jgi:hypothetical protein